MANIRDEIREIDQQIAELYQRKRFLEMVQQREWEKDYPPYTAMNAEWLPENEIRYDNLFNSVYGNNN